MGETQKYRVNQNCKCDGCKRKIRKLLQKIKGVSDVEIDMEKGKVIVTGTVEPEVVIKKLEKPGRRSAELWDPPKASSESSGESTATKAQQEERVSRWLEDSYGNGPSSGGPMQNPYHQPMYDYGYGQPQPMYSYGQPSGGYGYEHSSGGYGYEHSSGGYGYGQTSGGYGYGNQAPTYNAAEPQGCSIM